MIESIIEKIAELTEKISSITPATVLDELDARTLWRRFLLIFASTEFGVQLDGRDVLKAETVEALHELIASARINAS